MKALALSAAIALPVIALPPPPLVTSHLPAPAAGTLVALKAGTVHLVEGGEVIEGGATILVRDGRIAAVGRDVEVPPGARVVDYGADAVVVPGLVAASSSYAPGVASARTADPGVRAADALDLYSDVYLFDIAGGVTTAYVAPARGRLIAGQGAVIKLAGEDVSRRVLEDVAAIHGTIGPQAREVPGYWEPPVPATADVGLGVAELQLPKSTMGAIVALREILREARGETSTGEYGPDLRRTLEPLLAERVPWRLGAKTEPEVRALLRLAREEDLALVLEGASQAGDLAAEIAAAGVAVVVEVDIAPESPGRDFGKGRDDAWPVYDAAGRLHEAGVPIAIATPEGVRARHLRFAAALASRGGLEPEVALRAITLGAAEVLGVADRVGSIAPGKDADFAVLNGPPLAVTTSVVATWIGGEPVWKVAERESTVIEVGELHLGDGRVLRPGQVLLAGGRVAEVGERVAHPLGAVVVRGAAAMPGMIDSLGHLGLEGSGKTPATDFKLARLVEPGDRVDRRVARSGVTTVVLTPRGTSSSGTPMMAYKPAGQDVAAMVIADPTALRLKWSEDNRLESGKSVRELLQKAVGYDQKWREYEEAIAAWQPPPEAPAKETDGKDGDEKEEGKADGKDEEKPAKKDEKKKDEEEEEDAEPLTGIWEGKLTLDAAESDLRLRLERAGRAVTGSLRCDAVSDSLVLLAGSFADGDLELKGIGSRGVVQIEGKIEKDALKATLRLGEAAADFEAERTSRELKRIARPEMRREKKDEAEPKGKPRKPGLDDKLEPLRRAMRGEAAVVVTVDRESEILECVAAFEEAGIRPVLHGADDAWRVAGEIQGRVAGVLLGHKVLEFDPREGLEGLRNRYAELAAAGIPVGFHSAAEEGASELALMAAFAVSQGLSPQAALRGLTADAAHMLSIAGRVGLLAAGRDADVLLLDGPPLEPSTRVLRTWVDGREVR